MTVGTDDDECGQACWFQDPYCNVDGTVLYSVFINEGTMMGNDVRSLTCPEDESNQRWVKLSRPFT